MKVHLLFKDRDFDLQQQIPADEQTLVQDLELNILFDAMANGDDFISGIVKKTILLSLCDADTIIYRQNILKDCLSNASIIREIYQIPLESIENKRKSWLRIFGFGSSPLSIMHSSVEILNMYVNLLIKIKVIADRYADKFESEGFKQFFTMIKNELNDAYFAEVKNHLKELQFNSGMLISAELGKGNEGTGYSLRKAENKSWIKRIFAKKTPVYSFNVNPLDENGGKTLERIKDRAINLAANAVARSSDHIDSFFNMLRVELAFYIGCMNLHDKLLDIGETISFPVPVSSGERGHHVQGLYDVCLALITKQKTVSNDLKADYKNLIIITGANRGGKSTFLRSIGAAQLMMQCGMFVCAGSFSSSICNGFFTHYKREEDAAMKSGKLDEELSRMNTIADKISTDSMLLFNESFAATNEREGSEIAKQIINALVEKQIKVFFVTHLSQFAREFYDINNKNVLFLRAERRSGGERTFKIIEGEPLQTGYGEDLYYKIFGTDI